MIFFCIAILAYLSICNVRLSKSLFYPPAIFAGFWAVMLFLLLLSGDRFYPLLNGSLLVFVVGAVCYSGGGVLGIAISQRRYQPLSPAHRKFIWRVIDVGLLAMIVVFPLYLGKLSEIINNSHTTFDPAIALRYETTVSEKGVLGLEIYAYAISIFNFLTLLAWCECDDSSRQRTRCWIMTALILAYNMCNASRLNALVFVATLIWMRFLRKKTFSLTPIVAGGIAVAAIYSVIAIFLGKGGHRDADLFENIIGVFNAFLTYLLGGLVAFNEVIRNPSIIEPDTFAFFQSVANAFGADYYISRFQPFFVPTPEITNTFTIYMSFYAEFGYLGVAIYLFLLGSFCAWVFKAWQCGAPWAVLFYSRVLAGIMFVSAMDPFLRSLSVWIQWALLCWAIYELPRLFFSRMAPSQYSIPQQKMPCVCHSHQSPTTNNAGRIGYEA